MSTFDRLVLAKTELILGVDPTPTPALNAIRVITADIKPNIEAIDRKVQKNTMGNLPHMIGKKTATLDIEVEMKGSGAAGTPPEIAPLLKACGRVETINAGVSVVYQPSTTSNSTVTVYVYKDGLLWKCIGGRGKVTYDTTIGQITSIKFSFQVLYTAPVTQTVPTGAAYQSSQPIVATTIDVATENGTAIKVAAIGFDDGNDMQEHYVIGEHSFQIANRQPTAKLTKDSVGSTAEWDNLVAGLDANISFTFGQSTGNKFKCDMPVARKDGVTYNERAERDILDVTYRLYESVGDDQYTFTYL